MILPIHLRFNRLLRRGGGLLVFASALGCFSADYQAVTLPNAVYGSPYSQSLCAKASFGKCEYMLKMRPGFDRLPTGMQFLNGEVIAGTPSGGPATAQYGVIVDVQDTSGKLLQTMVVTLTTSSAAGGTATGLQSPDVNAATVPMHVQFHPVPQAGDTLITVQATPTANKDPKQTVSVSLLDVRTFDRSQLAPGETAPNLIDGFACDPRFGSLMSLKQGGKNPATTDPNGVASFTLAQPLSEGSHVCAYQSITDPSGKNVQIEDHFEQTATIPVSDTLDWGRSRAYFTGGILLANDSSGFSSAHQFYSFNFDRAWLLPECYACVDPNSTRPDAPAWAKFGYPGINTSFEARLTAIPVAPNTPATTSSTGSAKDSAFLSSQKTARLSADAYFPFMLTRWRFRGDDNGFAIAPRAVVGFNTLTGPTNQLIPNPAGGTTTASFERLYNFYAYGVRFAQYKMTGKRNQAPELETFFDVTYGRFSNLESFLCRPSSVNTTYSGSSCAQYGSSDFSDSRIRLYRLDFEGTLKIPYTPMIIGFNANIGPRTFAQRIDTAFQPPDDLRFLFGFRSDVGTIITKLGIGNPNK